MHIGTIVSDQFLSGIPPFFKVVSTDNYNGNDGKPTLIIGRKNTERLFPSQKLTYLDRKFGNINWTFSIFEKRNMTEKDLKSFIQGTFKTLLKPIEYYNVDILSLRYSSFRKFINFLKSERKKTVFISDNYVYIYSSNRIYGIYLEETRWIGINDDRVISYLNDECNNIDIYYKDGIKVSDAISEKYIPYFYHLAT